VRFVRVEPKVRIRDLGPIVGAMRSWGRKYAR